jgi:hypothetical protein
MPCGDTNPFQSTISRIYYLPNMAQAQIALGSLTNNNWQPLSPAYPPPTQSQRQTFLAIMAAIGKGIGTYMDCGGEGNPACPGTDPPYLHYEYFSCSGYPPSQSTSGAQVLYLDVGTPLHWGDPAASSLQTKLLGK